MNPFFDKYLGEYPHKMLNIYEIPFYAGAYFSFNSGIALSEKEGWLADFENKKEEQAYVNLLLATSIFRHWFQTNLPIAHIQGADNLQKGISRAFALCFVSEHFDVKTVKAILDKMNDQ